MWCNNNNFLSYCVPIYLFLCFFYVFITERCFISISISTPELFPKHYICINRYLIYAFFPLHYNEIFFIIIFLFYSHFFKSFDLVVVLYLFYCLLKLSFKQKCWDHVIAFLLPKKSFPKKESFLDLFMLSIIYWY